MRMPFRRHKCSLYILMLILLILSSLLPIAGALSAFISNVWARQVEQAENSARFYVEQLFDSSTVAMNTVQGAAHYMISNGIIRQVMAAPTFDAADQQVLEQTLGQMILYNSVWHTSDIRSFYLFREDGAALSVYQSDKYDAQYRRIKSIYDEYQDFSSARTLVRGTDTCCYFLLDYTDYQTNAVYGKILFELDISSMLSADALQTSYPSAAVVLSTTEGALLSNQSGFTDSSISRALGRAYLFSYEAEEDFDGQTMFHKRQRISGYDLYIDVYLPMDEITAPLWGTTAAFIGWLGVLLVLTGTISVSFGRLLLDPIRSTAETMGRMAAGDLTVRMEPQHFRETEQIADAFNDMADHLETLYQDAYDKGVRLRATEYQLLEAQINPHFIFNVLETVNMRCLAAGHPEISRIVADLAELLRAGVHSRSHQKVTFADELRYVRYYLDLQKARFQEALEYEIDYEDESILSYYLPKLTIQPLVENAVVHGLEPRQEGGRVAIKLWEEDEVICVRIEDDGVGFDLSQQPPAFAAQSKHTHIALPNIRERLYLLYRNAAQLKITSSPGQGTTVLLTIPIDDKED